MGLALTPSLFFFTLLSFFFTSIFFFFFFDYLLLFFSFFFFYHYLILLTLNNNKSIILHYYFFPLPITHFLATPCNNCLAILLWVRLSVCGKRRSRLLFGQLFCKLPHLIF